MPGLIIMLLITAAIAAVMYYLFASFWIAIGIFFAVFIIWFFINVSAGSMGLVKANLQAYFSARKYGKSHNEAITNVINSRFLLSSNNREKVLAIFNEAGPYINEEDELKQLVYIIFEYELGARPSSDWQGKIKAQINDVYSQLANSK